MPGLSRSRLLPSSWPRAALRIAGRPLPCDDSRGRRAGRGIAMNTGSGIGRDDTTPAAWLDERDTKAEVEETTPDGGLVVHLIIGLSAAAVGCGFLVKSLAAILL